MRCGPTYTDPLRGSTDVVYRILLETEPGHIPIEQPTKLNFCTNKIQIAIALGLTRQQESS